MSKMLDIYGPISSAELDKFIAADEDAFGRYLGRKSMGFSKGMTIEEKTLITSIGKQIVSIYQDKNNYAAYFTLQQGLLDGARALEDAKWLEQPYNTAIYFPADYDVQQHDLAAIQAYLEGAKRSLSGLYKLGFYGGYFAVENITGADFYGQTAAWSGGKISAKAHWYQRVIDTTLDGYNVDLDTITGDVGAWPDVYPSVPVTVNNESYAAIDVNGDTYIVWTAFRDAGENITKAEYGDVEIGDKKPPQIAYNKNTYVIYSAFTYETHVRVGEGWAFNTKRTVVTVPGKDPVTVSGEPPVLTAAETLLGNILKMVPNGIDVSLGSNTYLLLRAIAYGIAK